MQKIAEKQPNNVEVRKRRFEQAIAAKDVAAGERALKEVEAIIGEEDAYALYARAVLLCLQADNSKDAAALLEQALDYLKRARNIRKDWGRISTLEGSIYDQQGKSNLALQSFLEGIEQGDRNPVGVQRAVLILFRSQRYAEADRLLRRLLAERRSLPTRLMQTLAECALYLKDADRAVEVAQKAVPSNSKNGGEQAWLGQILGVVGRQAKAEGRSADAAELLGDAEKALRRAVKLEPKLPIVWRALVQYYALLNEQFKAETVIDEARKSLSTGDLPPFLAQCYEMVGNLDAAEEQYNAMLKAAPQDMAVLHSAVGFYHRAKKAEPAEALLQTVLDGKIPASDLELAWARRELAQFLGASGKYPNLHKAQKLVEQNLASPQASIADRELLARLLASDPDPRQEGREKAIRVFESLGASATQADRFLLARLYAKAGNWLKTGELLRGLVASNQKEPQYLEFYIDELLKHGEMSSAQTYFNYLEKLAPNAFGTASRKADLLFATNQPRQAFAVLRDYVDNVDAETRDRGYAPPAGGREDRPIGREIDEAGPSAHRRKRHRNRRIAVAHLRQGESRPGTGVGGIPGTAW